MLFDDMFVRSIKHDPLASVLHICRSALGALDGPPDRWVDSEYQALTEAVLLLHEISEAEMFKFSEYFPTLERPQDDVCTQIVSFLNTIQARCEDAFKQSKFNADRARFRISLGTQFSYEFTEGDLDRVQQLLNELRVQFSTASFLGEDHRQRHWEDLKSCRLSFTKASPISIDSGV